MKRFILISVICLGPLVQGTSIRPEETKEIKEIVPTLERPGYGNILDRKFYSELWHHIMHGHGRIRRGQEVVYKKLKLEEPQDNIAPVPEPATLFLLGMGLVGLFIRRKKNERKEFRI